MLVLFNGHVAQRPPVDDRGLAFGDGLFETLLVRDGAPVWLEEHLQRLAAGCERLSIDCDPAVLRGEIDTLLASVSSTWAVLKIVVTRCSGGARGYRPVTCASNRLLLCEPFAGASRKQWQQGISAELCRTRLPRSPQLAGLKHLSRLEQVLASAERAPHCQEGLVLDDSGNLIEGTMSNLFLVADNQLLTPRLDQCGVAGVVRRRVLEHCAEQGMMSSERPLSPEHLYRASELFLTSSLSGIRPLTRLGCHAKEPGPVTRRLQQAFEPIWF